MTSQNNDRRPDTSANSSPSAIIPVDVRVADASRRLQDWLTQYPRIVIAFSGGVDSSVVAAAAAHVEAARGGAVQAIAVTAESPSVPAWQLHTAKQLAAEIGIRHRIVQTDEWTNEDYQRN